MRFLEIGNYPQIVGNEIHQLCAATHKLPNPRRYFTQSTCARRANFGTAQINLGQFGGGIGIGNLRLERAATDLNRACLFDCDSSLRHGLLNRSLSLPQRGKCLVAFAQRNRAFADEIVDPPHIRRRPLQSSASANDRGILKTNLRLSRTKALAAIIQIGLLSRYPGTRLLHPLAEWSVVDTGEQLTFSHALEIGHRHFDKIARDLRADYGCATADISVVGGLVACPERRQAPCEQHCQHARNDKQSPQCHFRTRGIR